MTLSNDLGQRRKNRVWKVSDRLGEHAIQKAIMKEKELGTMWRRKGKVTIDDFTMLWIDNGLLRGSWHDFSTIIDNILKRLFRY